MLFYYTFKQEIIHLWNTKKKPKVYTDASLTSFGLFHTQTTPYASGHSL